MVGAESGRLFVFDGTSGDAPTLVRSVAGHVGSVSCVHATDLCILSGGADGMVGKLVLCSC